MQVARHTVVSIEYELRTADGTRYDHSPPGELLTYLQGVGGMLPGLEAALEGRSAGESLSFTVTPQQGYGLRDEQLRAVLERDAFPKGVRIEHGMRFRGTVQHLPRVITVTGFEKDGRVKVDANHPLAGETLHFQVRIVDVRPATADEIAHRHVHGPGGHHH